MCKVWKSMFFFITPIIWNFKNLYELLHKLSVVSVWMWTYSHIFAKFLNAGIFFKFSLHVHIFEFFQIFSCFNQNFYGISKKNFQNFITKFSTNAYFDNAKRRTILFWISRWMTCQQFLHQCNQHDKQWETFSSINWIHYFW